MSPEEIAKSWRKDDSEYMNRRRCMTVLSLINIACLGAIGLYQAGVIQYLPDPPVRAFNSKKVTGSAVAYTLLSAPDSALGLNNYSLTLMLMVMGGPDRTKEKPWLPVLAAGKALFDLALSGAMLSREVFRQRSLCALCLTVNVSTALIAALSVKEAKSALDTLSAKKSDSAPDQYSLSEGQ